MNTSTEHILQCNQSEPLADASGRIVDLMNENDSGHACLKFNHVLISRSTGEGAAQKK